MSGTNWKNSLLKPRENGHFSHLSLFFHLSLPKTSTPTQLLITFLKSTKIGPLSHKALFSESICKLVVSHIHFYNCSKKALSLNSYHGNHTKVFFTNFKFSKTLKGIPNTLQNLKFVQLTVDEIAGEGWGYPSNPLGIKCGSEIAWYRKG